MFERAASHSQRDIDFFGTRLTLPPEARFASVESVQRYVDDVLALVATRWSAGPVTVRARRGATAAHYERDGDRAAIAVPDDRNGSAWAMRELVIFFGHFTAVYSTIPVQRPESHDGGCRNRAFGCP